MTKPTPKVIFAALLLAGSSLTATALMAAENKPADEPPKEAAPPSASTPSEAPPSIEVNIADLLANPIPAHPELKYLYQRRSWLAANSADPMNFQVVAQEFAEKEALFSAIELAWFAEKMTEDAAIREGLETRMKTWMDGIAPINARIEQARQYFDAGKSKEALEDLLKTLTEYPYAERAHYEVSNLQFRIYLQQAVSFETLMPAELRVKLFRTLYEHLTCTIAIDPMYYDAYYLLGSIREVLPDAKEFLVATEGLTAKALTFHNEVLPVMELIEQGKREPELFEQLGAGLEGVGVMDYAVFSYRAAILRGSKNPEVPKHMEAIIQKYFKKQQ